MERQPIREFDKQLIVQVITEEYRVLRTEAAGLVGITVSVLSMFTGMVAAAIGVAFSQMDREPPLLASVLLNVVFPFLVLTALIISYVLLFWRSRLFDYISNVLESRANQLLGSSIEAWLYEAATQTTDKGQQGGVGGIADIPGNLFESSRRVVWGWQGWTQSEQFRKAYHCCPK